MEEDSCLEKRESTGHIALEITPLEPPKVQESPMTSYLREELEGVSFPRCIFRVPSKFRSQKEDAYEPTLVSIGPMHHGKGNLRDMEDHKWKYLHSLLNRNLTLDTTLESCIQALKVLEPKIRACYDEDLSHIPSDKFLTMILLDGAFIIELFLRRYVRGLRTRDDTLFKSQETSHRLANDLILLENQIPFFVLRRIFSLIPLPKQLDKTISELSLKFFKNMILRDIHILHEKYSFDGSNHLLDLIWKCYLPTVHKYPLSSDKNLGRDIKSASKVQESGIKVSYYVYTHPLIIKIFAQIAFFVIVLDLTKLLHIQKKSVLFPK